MLFWVTKHPGARVTAFEPDPAVFAVLSENVAAWASAGRDTSGVELVNAAVGAGTATLPFLPDDADGGRVLGDGETRVAATVEVPVELLSDRLTEPVDLLKIDVEGAEADVLIEVADRLDEVRRAFVEVHSFADRPQWTADVLRVLAGAGFRVLVQPEYCPPRPFLDRPHNAGMDNRVNLFAVRPS